MKTTIHLEDNIMQKGQTATAGSRILSGFTAPFDAEAVERLTAAGFTIGERLAMDEFAIDDLFTADGATLPAITAAAADHGSVVLCNDVFGKIRRQATAAGLYYLQPPYGAVSRHGLIPTAASMDRIGALGGDMDRLFAVMAIIAGSDGRDRTIQANEHMFGDIGTGKTRVMVPANVWGKATEIAKSLLSASFTVIEGTLPHYEVYHQTFFILAAAEICGNTNRYDGVHFGFRDTGSGNLRDLYMNTRGGGFSSNTKAMIILGAAVLTEENYAARYEKAMKIRRLIRDSLDFAAYDMIALPAGNSKPKYEQSALYALPALAGLASLSMPFADVGVQLVAGSRPDERNGD